MTENFDIGIDYSAENYGRRNKTLQYLDAYEKAKEGGMKFFMEESFIGGIGVLRFTKKSKEYSSPIEDLLNKVKKEESSLRSRLEELTKALDLYGE